MLRATEKLNALLLVGFAFWIVKLKVGEKWPVSPGFCKEGHRAASWKASACVDARFTGCQRAFEPVFNAG